MSAFANVRVRKLHKGPEDNGYRRTISIENAEGGYIVSVKDERVQIENDGLLDRNRKGAETGNVLHTQKATDAVPLEDAIRRADELFSSSVNAEGFAPLVD